MRVRQAAASWARRQCDDDASLTACHRRRPAARGRHSTLAATLHHTVPTPPRTRPAARYNDRPHLACPPCVQGAFATVWKARCPSKDMQVAIKIMQLESLTTTLEEIQAEVKTMKLSR